MPSLNDPFYPHLAQARNNQNLHLSRIFVILFMVLDITITTKLKQYCTRKLAQEQAKKAQIVSQ